MTVVSNGMPMVASILQVYPAEARDYNWAVKQMLEKDDIRKAVWQAMRDAGVAAFPGAMGRIPNFTGSGKAHLQLAELDVWKNARVIKSNPDLPQRPLRRLALEQGKTVYMAVPRLTEEKCFVELDPDRFTDYRLASSIKGAAQLGRLVHPDEMRAIDLIVCGSVAVNRKGARLGKGGGYSDLEYAVALSLGLISDLTPIVTTVHPVQLLSDDLPMTAHDISLDYIGMPEELVACAGEFRRPAGIIWGDLGDKLDEVPILQAMKARGCG